jgi:asparagine synthase (glutamine-hydrolysing)
MFLLSELVRKNNYKVVLTGEGADEFLAGYDIFKEAKVRRFWARQPDSTLRPLLIKRLHPYLGDVTSGGGTFLEAFFKEGLLETENPEYSHAIRWKTTSRTKRFFSDELRNSVLPSRSTDGFDIYYPPEFYKWRPLSQAQYLEITIFLSQYLLSSQGDRVAMAHSVEGRFPFLDYRVVEFCNLLPPEIKLYGLTEKYLLRMLVKEWLPDEIWRRPKKPYRAPIHRSFFNEDTQDYVHDLLSAGALDDTGFFKKASVAQMINKIKSGMRLSETDDMALAGIISTQLVSEQFVKDFRLSNPLSEDDDVKVCLGSRTIQGVRDDI